MSGQIYAEDIKIVKIFLDEWMALLDGFEKAVLKLELHAQDAPLLHQLFEWVHRIKGGSSFIGMAHITSLCYEIEKIFDAIKNTEVNANTELIDSLLIFVDFFKADLLNMNELIRVHDLTDEKGVIYGEPQFVKNSEQVLQDLILALDNSLKKVREEKKIQEKASDEAIDLEILHSEAFKNGLAEGIKEQFLQENLEHIDKIENDYLVRLGTKCDDREAINEIFRAVHSIKGGTGIYLAVIDKKSELHTGLKRFSEVVHTFETLLALIRDEGCPFKKHFVELSLLAIDYFKTFMEAIDSEAFHNLGDEDILQQINQQIFSLQASGGIGKSKLEVSQNADPKMEGDPSKSNTPPQSIRVNQDKLDKMMNMISELFIAKNSFMHISSKLNLEYDLPEISKEVKQVSAYVNRISDELQNAIMSIRMVEVKTVFQKMPRVIRDIAQSTGKKMELSMQGESTEIDKTIIEQISDPLVHLIRNSADHGIESQQERLSKGKPETGTIVLRAYNKNKHVYIEIEDDGKGIDAEQLKIKAIEKGLLTQMDAEKMSQKQLINLIFLPGFSMAKKITEVSGRGVGMDIVKSNISKINGKITIESEVGKGTKMVIQLPLTLAVSRGLVVEVSDETYIIPLESIVETVKIPRKSIHEYRGKYFTYLRGETIGVEWLSKVFQMGEKEENGEALNAIILSDGVENYAIVVDKLKNEQEFVVKTLDGHLASIPGISGSTLLGNGKVVLIINPADLLQLAEK